MHGYIFASYHPFDHVVVVVVLKGWIKACLVLVKCSCGNGGAVCVLRRVGEPNYVPYQGTRPDYFYCSKDCECMAWGLCNFPFVRCFRGWFLLGPFQDHPSVVHHLSLSEFTIFSSHFLLVLGCIHNTILHMHKTAVSGDKSYVIVVLKQENQTKIRQPPVTWLWILNSINHQKELQTMKSNMKQVLN